MHHICNAESIAYHTTHYSWQSMICWRTQYRSSNEADRPNNGSVTIPCSQVNTGGAWQAGRGIRITRDQQTLTKAVSIIEQQTHNLPECTNRQQTDTTSLTTNITVHIRNIIIIIRWSVVQEHSFSTMQCQWERFCSSLHMEDDKQCSELLNFPKQSMVIWWGNAGRLMEASEHG